MTSTPSTTIWQHPVDHIGRRIELPGFTRDHLVALAAQFAHQKGTMLLLSEEHAGCSFLFLFPITEVRAASWGQVASELHLESNAWGGYLEYEMGRTSAPSSQFWRYGAFIRLGEEAELFLIDEVASAFLCAPRFWESLQVPRESAWSPLTIARPLDNRATYIAKVERLLEEIRAGEIYQACLSHRCTLQGRVDPFSLFLRLSRISPAPFSAFLNAGDFCVVSSSPERFLKRSGNRLETRPIKGTAPRGRDQQEDERLCRELLASAKERAELTMITDLMRNDLGQVSRPGSVCVEELCRLEAYTNVFHLLSIVRSELMPDTSSIEVLRRIFPGGSISGCPKKRAIEILAEVEEEPRGVYTGSIGYFLGATDFDFNIAIRTVVAYPDRLEVSLGGGIVIDSNPLHEHEETLHKGRGIFQALNVRVD